MESEINRRMACAAEESEDLRKRMSELNSQNAESIRRLQQNQSEMEEKHQKELKEAKEARSQESERPSNQGQFVLVRTPYGLGLMRIS